MYTTYKTIKISPGSALKLYDYFLHKRFVITQDKLNGYSDEVLKYGYGTLVDFKSSKLSALKIINKIKKLEKKKILNSHIKEFSWNKRMTSWINCLKNID